MKSLMYSEAEAEADTKAKAKHIVTYIYMNMEYGMYQIQKPSQLSS